MVYHQTKFGYKRFNSLEDTTQTNINWNLNSLCDFDLEHSYPVFSLENIFTYDALPSNQVCLQKNH